MKSNASNAKNMKMDNKLLLLNTIRRKPISRAELAKGTGLSRAAVSIIVKDLINRNIIMETGSGHSDLGRKPILLDINPNRYYAIGLHISRNGDYVGVVDIKGRILAIRKLDFASIKNAQDSMPVICEAISSLIIDAGIDKDKILGIGVSSPGPVDVNKGKILNPPNFDMWHNFPISDMLEKSFPYDVSLENDASALTLAEKNNGKGKHYKNFVVIVVGAGVGAGVVLNNELYKGAAGMASEIGHMSIDFNGKKCSCGNKGCLELYASIPVLLKKIAAEYDKSISSWREIVNGTHKHGYLRDIIEEEADYLSAAIVNVKNLLDIEAIVLTGCINYKPELLLDGIIKRVSEMSLLNKLGNTPITMSSFSDDTGVISAAMIAIEKYFTTKGETEHDK